MKRAYFLALLFLGACLTASPAFSAPEGPQTEEVFAQANRAYAKGEYADAARLYEGLLTRGVRSGNLYYNLGNAYFKQGLKGRALVNLERARRLLRQDEDLFSNETFIKSLLEMSQPEDERSWQEGVWVTVRDLLSAGGWLAAVYGLYLVLLLLIGLAVFLPPRRKSLLAGSLAVGLAALAALCLFFGKLHFEKHSRFGIMVSPAAEVRYSPSSAGAVAFQLREGIRAELLRCEAGWCQIRLAKNKGGWVEEGNIEEI